MQQKSEAKIQSEIVSYYNNNFCLKHHSPRCLIMSVPNGGERTVSAAMTARSTGEYSGASDLIAIHHQSGMEPIVLFIEVKDDIGKQKPKQIEFEAHVTGLGFKYFIVRSLDEFKAIIDNVVCGVK